MMDENAAIIESVLDEFKLDARVTDATRGASVTRYELKLGNGVRIEKLARLGPQIAYATAAPSVRILAPIPGKTAVGVELPNRIRETVMFADALAAIPHDAHPLTVVLGQTIDGEMMSLNLADCPHLLVAGTTGSGKSTAINAMLVSLLRRATPDRVRLTLVDPKMVELRPYQGVAHLSRPVITEVDEAVAALNDLVGVMERRYRDMESAGVRHIDQLQGYPYEVVVIDEFADLIMQVGKAAELPLARIAQKGRAAGVHAVVATQRPSVDVITGLIKANFPSRLAFATASGVDSQVVLDERGADQLLGGGDGLAKPIGARTAIRVQGAYVSDKEIEAAVQEWTVRPEANNSAAAPTIVGHPSVEVRVLDELIDYAGAALERLDRYLELLNNSRIKGDEKMFSYFDGPIEISKAAIAMDDIIRGLRDIRQGAGVPC